MARTQQQEVFVNSKFRFGKLQTLHLSMPKKSPGSGRRPTSPSATPSATVRSGPPSTTATIAPAPGTRPGLKCRKTSALDTQLHYVFRFLGTKRQEVSSQ